MSGVGVFGGTFDPIHHGHLRSALELQQALALAEVRFVPCRRPPHRTLPVASPEARAEMVERAIAMLERVEENIASAALYAALHGALAAVPAAIATTVATKDWPGATRKVAVTGISRLIPRLAINWPPTTIW